MEADQQHNSQDVRGEQDEDTFLSTTIQSAWGREGAARHEDEDLAQQERDQNGIAHHMAVFGSISPQAASTTEFPNGIENAGEIYSIGHRLGSGGFGTVYSGHRCRDWKPVAIKRAKGCKAPHVGIAVNGQVDFFPLEAILTTMASAGEDGGVIGLLDCFSLHGDVFLVLERPEPCMDLHTYILSYGCLREGQAKGFLSELLEAAMHILAKGVYHRDIKPGNILIQRRIGLHVKVIDFGCGTLLKEVHVGRAGTAEFNPPELNCGCPHRAEPATVWQLGATLYAMMHGHAPFRCKHQVVVGQLYISAKLSGECIDFISWCLNKNPQNRPTLRDLRSHPWLGE